MKNYKFIVACIVTVANVSTLTLVTSHSGERQRHVIRQGEVTEIISNSVTSGVSAHISRSKRAQRARRAENSLSADDIQTCLDKHNDLRKDEGASDMRKMVSQLSKGLIDVSFTCKLGNNR